MREYAKEVRDSYSVFDYYIRTINSFKNHNNSKFNMVIKESKAYGLYISYASDIEGLKRDYAKSDLIILEGIRLLEDCDYDGCKIILKMYDQFK